MLLLLLLLLLVLVLEPELLLLLLLRRRLLLLRRLLLRRQLLLLRRLLLLPVHIRLCARLPQRLWRRQPLLLQMLLRQRARPLPLAHPAIAAACARLLDLRKQRPRVLCRQQQRARAAHEVGHAAARSAPPRRRRPARPRQGRRHSGCRRRAAAPRGCPAAAPVGLEGVGAALRVVRVVLAGVPCVEVVVVSVVVAGVGAVVGPWVLWRVAAGLLLQRWRSGGRRSAVCRQRPPREVVAQALLLPVLGGHEVAGLRRRRRRREGHRRRQVGLGGRLPLRGGLGLARRRARGARL